MRDRLTSLIDTFFASVDIDKFYSQNQKEKLVEWLNSNGVIVPPCKVGDVVWVCNQLCDLYKEAKGYRKQREGEWIVTHKNGIWFYDCPFCDDGYAQKEKLPPSNYCSNCGAKLKGGEG